MTNGGRFAATLMGVAFFFVGLALLVFETITPPRHTSHIIIFIGLTVFGALAISPEFILMRLKDFVSVAGPFVPGYAARQAVTAAHKAAVDATTAADSAAVAEQLVQKAAATPPKEQG